MFWCCYCVSAQVLEEIDEQTNRLERRNDRLEAELRKKTEKCEELQAEVYRYNSRLIASWHETTASAAKSNKLAREQNQVIRELAEKYESLLAEKQQLQAGCAELQEKFEILLAEYKSLLEKNQMLHENRNWNVFNRVAPLP